jgi:hypothetical protein
VLVLLLITGPRVEHALRFGQGREEVHHLRNTTARPRFER